jgi:phage terminase small subunit
MELANLTVKQRRFCEEYLVDLNATQAAIRAGYSPKTANEQGARLLVNVSIQKRIQKLMDERAKRTNITQDMVIQELAKIAFSNIGDYLKIETCKDGNFEYKRLVIFDTDSIPADKKSAIQEIKQNSNGGISFKLHDKIKALELLGRHLGIFNDKIELSTANPFDELSVEELRALARQCEEDL